MRRKIIKQGNNSYTLTLPIKWIRDNNLDEGGEIEINDYEGNILVSSDTIKKKKDISLEITSEYGKNIRFILNEVYRQGYDSIRVEAPNKGIINQIQDLSEELFFEMEAIEKKEKYCTLEMLSEPTEEKYHLILKKMFFIVYDSFEELSVSLGSKKFDLAKIESSTSKFRKYDNYCRRFIINNVKGTKGYNTHSLLVHLLMIQTDLKRFYEDCSKGVIKFSKNEHEHFLKVIHFYKKSYESFFEKDIKSLNNINFEINKYFKEEVSVLMSRKNALFYHYLFQMERILYSMIVPMIGLSIKIKKST